MESKLERERERWSNYKENWFLITIINNIWIYISNILDDCSDMKKIKAKSSIKERIK